MIEFKKNILEILSEDCALIYKNLEEEKCEKIYKIIKVENELAKVQLENVQLQKNLKIKDKEINNLKSEIELLKTMGSGPSELKIDYIREKLVNFINTNDDNGLQPLIVLIEEDKIQYTLVDKSKYVSKILQNKDNVVRFPTEGNLKEIIINLQEVSNVKEVEAQFIIEYVNGDKQIIRFSI